MSQVAITDDALRSIDRCCEFLQQQSPRAAIVAAKTIEEQFRVLENMPHAGRPFLGLSELREWIIDFGDSGYVALYRYDAKADVVYILAFRHQKEMFY